MASFVGSIEEFRRYVGPRLRNIVQQISKRHKNEVGACEHCGSTENLESAHVRGRDRNEIIEYILNDFITNSIITVDLSLFEERFKNEHHPIEKSILVLCRHCHHEYDANEVVINVEAQVANAASNNQVARQIIHNDVLPITLDPSDPNLFKQELLTYQKAEIATMYHDGTVERRVWNAARFTDRSNIFGNLRSRPEYRAGNWQANGIVKVHVTIISNA